MGNFSNSYYSKEKIVQVKLVAITKPIIEEFKDMTAEELLVAIARVSNPSNQTNTLTAPKLIRYCAENGHWSVFDMVEFTVEIVTSLAIAPQILRHRSACFQQFSLRYAEAENFEPIELRLQGVKNKQGSQEVYDDPETAAEVAKHVESTHALYKKLIGKGISRETARMVLPTCTQTCLYMKNTVRNFLAWMNVRLHNHTQKEHRLIAEGVRDIFLKEFPIVSEAFDNFKNAYNEKFM